ncbi:MAG: LPS-assembly protein LptD [Azoarcus sp.]|jgi:LPS-assembly protein|nr:LPS-assembly protein LptD [Azoarcus sp.]
MCCVSGVLWAGPVPDASLDHAIAIGGSPRAGACSPASGKQTKQTKDKSSADAACEADKPAKAAPNASGASATPADWRVLASAIGFGPKTANPAPSPWIPGETRISALRIHGTHAIDIVAEGEVELQRDALTLTADRLTYREPTDEVVAEGNVRLRQGDSAEMSGPAATLVVGPRTGEFREPKYSMTRSRPPIEEGDPPRLVSGSGKADLLQLEGENQYRARNASWSTCPAPDPDWYIKAWDLELDYDREIGVARGSSVVFKDVPFVWLPWAEFPLAGQRHSGLLPPTMDSSTKTGFGVTLPYYWNIAPNYDFTLSPHYMSRRGMQLGAETRYMGASYRGTARVEYLAHDSESGQKRSLGSLQHQQWLTPGLYGALDLNAVSDDEYFEDLSTRVSMASKVNLLREGRLMYVGGGWWSASALAQSYQTLSPDPRNPVVTPYRRLPQIALNAMRPAEFRDAIGTSGLDFAWNSEFTRFTHPRKDYVDASRLTAYPQLSLPLQWSGFYITPKVGLHYTRYNIDRDRPVAGMREDITRSAPVFSLDSGLAFERETSLFGTNYVQTLEPRLYYLSIPYRKQDDIPLFDTSRYDFGFAQIFSENLYTGGDRLADARQLTAAVTTRLIDPATGAERLRLLLGQRYYFADQRVTLNHFDEQGKMVELETARTSKRADVLTGFSARIGKHTSFESLWQYNPREYETERYSVALRYNPGHTRALNLGYRYVHDVLRDVDISGQWPLWGKWYGVARLTHSLKDSRLTEAIAGLEYDGGCWVLRMGGHRYATREDEVNEAFFLQLELNDFTSIGPGGNVVNMIRRSVPGYGRINEPGGAFGD